MALALHSILRNEGIFILVMVCACTHGFALPFEGLWRLDVIHYNDFHSRFEETTVSSPFCTTNDSHCLGGFPRLFSVTRSLLEEKPHALLLNAGDSFQGTLWYTLLKWNVTQQFMNLLPHDAHALGNHEFDDGPSGLAPYLKRLKAPCLAANMDTSSEPILQGLCQNSTVVERNGRRIGIIGVITVSTALYASPGNTVFTDERLAAQREAAKLADQGVDIVVLLSHAGLDVDRDIAENYGENIDLIVGGHTHSLLWSDGVAPSGEAVADTYPVIVRPGKKSEHKVVIVQASAFTKYVGNLTIYFDFRGDFYSWEGGPIFLNRSYPEDEEVKEMLKPYADQVHEAASRVLGYTDVDLKKESCEHTECLLGNVICDGMLQYAEMHHPTELAVVAIISKQTIYGSILQGEIKFGTVFETFPYCDRILSFNIKAEHLLQAFERSFGGDGFQTFQVAGIKVKLNSTQSANERVYSAKVQNKTRYHELGAEEVVRVIAPDFLVRSSGFTMLDENRWDTKVIGHDSDIFEKFLQRNSPLHPNLERRIEIMK